MVYIKSSDSYPAPHLTSVLHPLTDFVRYAEEGPHTIVRGNGVQVEDADGRRYIEGVSGLWSISLGFGQQRLADAAYKQFMELSSYHIFRGKSHPRAVELADRLLSIAPAPMSKVFFANSGSEANDTAVKLVWYYNNALNRPKKKKIISRLGSYHGVTVASGSMTGIDRIHAGFDLPLPGFLYTDCPAYWKCGLPGESEGDFVERLARNLEALIERQGPETIAAFIAEPIMGVGGVILPPAGYFERITPILKRHEILFIVDEIITGFGRLGCMFGSEAFGLRPDILTCAKGLSSGYLPISAVMINEDIWEACFRQSRKSVVFGHGFTTSAHPVSAAVAIETLRLFDELDIPGNVKRNAPILQEGLHLLSKHPLVGDARGKAFIGAVELVRNKDTKEAFDPAADIGLFVERRCLSHGVILRALGDTIAIAPPLIADDGAIETILEKLAVALDETLLYAKRNGYV